MGPLAPLVERSHDRRDGDAARRTCTRRARSPQAWRIHDALVLHVMLQRYRTRPSQHFQVLVLQALRKWIEGDLISTDVALRCGECCAQRSSAQMIAKGSHGRETSRWSAGFTP